MGVVPHLLTRREWAGTLVGLAAGGGARADGGKLLGAAETALDRKPGFVLAQAVGSGELLAAHRLGEAALRLAHPGSSLKPFVLKALIDSGRFRESLRFLCPGVLRLKGRNFNCTHPRLARPFDAVEALAYSCNAWFAQAARLLEPVELANSLRAAGLAERPGLAPDEAAGRIELAAAGDRLALQALGEENVVLTPVGLLCGYRRLARLRAAGEARYRPIWQGLRGAVEYGTGQLAQKGRAPVAGKTGTATKMAGPGRHAWFAGYAPSSQPGIVVVVFVEDGLGGSDAAPVAGAVFGAAFGTRDDP